LLTLSDEENEVVFIFWCVSFDVNIV